MHFYRRICILFRGGIHMNVKTLLTQAAMEKCNKPLAECTNEEIYYLLLDITKDLMQDAPAITGDKKLYYISAEFLIGKLLSNNLINLGIYKEVKEVLAENGKNMAEIEEAEAEPRLLRSG